MVTPLFSICYKKNFFFVLCCAVSIIIGSGCGLYKTRHIKTTDLKLKNDINDSIIDLYPDRFKAIHRVILTLSGKNYVLNGYLSVDRPNREINLIAQNDLGGIIFDVHFIKNVETSIRITANMIKKKWLETSVLRDLETIYLKEPFSSPTLFSDQHGALILSEKQGQITHELIYKKINSPEYYQLAEIRHLKNRRCIYAVNLKYGSAHNNLYPEIIFVRDTKMNYTLQITVQYFME